MRKIVGMISFVTAAVLAMRASMGTLSHDEIVICAWGLAAWNLLYLLQQFEGETK